MTVRCKFTIIYSPYESFIIFQFLCHCEQFSYSSVIARSEATKQSREKKVHALDCFATLAMTDGDFVFCNDDVRKIAASSVAMTGRKWIATRICILLTQNTERRRKLSASCFDTKTLPDNLCKPFDKNTYYGKIKLYKKNV